MDETISRKYRDVCPETVARIYAAERAKHKGEREADRAARARLHQITGAFMTDGEARRAERLLERWLGGDESAFRETLLLHSSTRERLEGAEALYDRALAAAGHPDSALDLACGLNPLLLGRRGLKVYGVDISGACVRLVNRWAEACGWDVRAECRDLLLHPPLPPAGLALAMKLLPVLEQQGKGAAMALLRDVPAEFALVTFPLRTLGGRRVGMEKHYSDWFEAQLPGAAFGVVDRFLAADELCYVVRRNGDAHAVCGGDADRQPE